jgi:hypothetical protein
VGARLAGAEGNAIIRVLKLGASPGSDGDTKDTVFPYNKPICASNTAAVRAISLPGTWGAGWTRWLLGLVGMSQECMEVWNGMGRQLE